MTDDESLLPDYRKALTSIKGRCPIPPRIEWIAEQAAREAIKSIDSYGGAGQQPPTVPELCATSVTYRGKSEGFDRRIWDAKGLASNADAARKRNEAGIESQAQAAGQKQNENARLTQAVMIQGIATGKYGSWVCQPAKKANLGIDAIVRDAKRSTNPIFVKKGGRTLSGSMVGNGWMYEATVKDGSSEMSVLIGFNASDDALETQSFAIKAKVVGTSVNMDMACTIIDD